MELSDASEEAARELGFEQIKSKRCEAIEAFFSGRDIFVSLSTGYGKSIIYAIMPILHDKMTGT